MRTAGLYRYRYTLWVGFAGDGLRVGRGERSAPGLRLLSRPLIRSSRAAVARVRWWVGMVVRFVCVSVCPCVSRLPPVSFYRYTLPLDVFLRYTYKYLLLLL